MKTSICRFIVSSLLLLILCARPTDSHAQTDRIVFAVISDYGLSGQPEADVANLVKSWNPEFIVTSGDNNQNSRVYEMDDNIGQYYHEYIYRYSGKYGEGSPTRRFFPAIGNHDWAGNGVKAYLDYFSLHESQRYYEFVQGPVHFFMLDSDRNEPDGVDARSEQAFWLKKALAASNAPFKVVVAHHPPYSSGKHGSTEYMRWPFKEWGADIVLSGHNHVYERSIVNGLPYIVNGLGGAGIYRFETVIPESIVRFNQDYGAMRVEATSTHMKFQMITRAGLLVDEFMLGQKIPHVASIDFTNPSPTNQNDVTFQVRFSETVTGVDLEDFGIATTTNGAAISNVSGSEDSYVVTVNTGTGDGTIRLDILDNDTILNSDGNPLGGAGLGNGSYTTGATYVIDRSAPTVTSITRASMNPTNAATVDFTVNFSEVVNNVDATDFSLTSNAGAQIVGINGSGSIYTVTVATGFGVDPSLRLDFVDNDSVIDLAGNPTSQAFSGEAYSIDRQPPIATAITRTGQESTSSVEFAVRFSEPVTGVDGSDFLLSTINSAFIQNIQGTGNLYLVTVAINPGSDVVRLDINDNDSILDLSGNVLGDVGIGNGNLIGESIPVAIDTPIVTSIIRTAPSPINASNVNFIVTFSETVNGVDISDFVLTGNADASIQSVNSVNPFYIVNVNTGVSDGALKLDLVDDDTITNAQGIPLGGRGAGNANFANGEIYVIDRISPQVTSIIRAGSNPTINPSVDFIVTFSEPVTGVDVSDFNVVTTNLNSLITQIQNADPFYIVTVSTGAGSGSIRLDVNDNRSITDYAGNTLANNGSGNGGFTNGESFNIAKIPVNFPAPNITTRLTAYTTNSPTPTLTWSTIRGAQAYEVFLAADQNFNQLVLGQTVSGTSFTPNQKLPDGTYFMRVWAFNASLNPGKFSKTYSFTVDTTPPSTPTLYSPKQNANAPKRPWLTWVASAGATQYQVELDNNSNFSSPEFSASTNKTSIQSKSLAIKQTYYWRVRAKDAAGNWSPWSDVFSMYIP